MPENRKITELPILSSAQAEGSAVLPIVQEGINYQISLAAIRSGESGGATLMRSALSPLFRVWTLPSIPGDPPSSQFFIEGYKQKFGIDYVINSAVVSWLGMNLKPNWTIEIYYR